MTLRRFMYIGSGANDWAENALRRAYAAAPGPLRAAIRRHLDRDLEIKDWVPTAQGLEPIWDVKIARILLSAAKAARGEAKIFRSLFETLIRQGSGQALDYGLQCIGALPNCPTNAERDNAVAIAALLVEYRTAVVWPLVRRRMQQDAEFGRALAVALAGDYGQDEGWWSQLGDLELGDLSLWLETRLPREKDKRNSSDSRADPWLGSSWDLDQLRAEVPTTPMR